MIIDDIMEKMKANNTTLSLQNDEIKYLANLSSQLRVDIKELERLSRLKTKDTCDGMIKDAKEEVIKIKLLLEIQEDATVKKFERLRNEIKELKIERERLCVEKEEIITIAESKAKAIIKSAELLKDEVKKELSVEKIIVRDSLSRKKNDVESGLDILKKEKEERLKSLKLEAKKILEKANEEVISVKREGLEVLEVEKTFVKDSLFKKKKKVKEMIKEAKNEELKIIEDARDKADEIKDKANNLILTEEKRIDIKREEVLKDINMLRKKLKEKYELEITHFPVSGGDKKVLMENSNFKEFDYKYTLELKGRYPELWKLGGTKYNNSYNLWGKQRVSSPNEQWLRERELWGTINRGKKTLVDVICMVKHGLIGDLGEASMKNIINKGKTKIDNI